MRSFDVFRDEVARGGDARLDRAAIALAAVADPLVEIDVELARLDDLATRFEGSTPDDLIRWMASEGFRGNSDDYYNPDNSMLHRVLGSGLGIPITLSVVAIELGRRHGMALVGIGAPGEFIVGERDNPDRFHNPYRGLSFGKESLQDFWRSLGHGEFVANPRILQPMSTVSIIERMLNNLEQIYVRRQSALGLEYVYRLRVVLPDQELETRRRYAEILERSGNFLEGISQIRSVMGSRHPSENLLTVRRDWLLLRRLEAHLN